MTHHIVKISKPDRINNEQTYRCTAKFNCDNFTDDVCCLVDRLSIDLDSMTQNFDINLENILYVQIFLRGFADSVNVTDKFDVLRGRLVENYNDFHWQLGGQINHQPCSYRAARVIRCTELDSAVSSF